MLLKSLRGFVPRIRTAKYITPVVFVKWKARAMPNAGCRQAECAMSRAGPPQGDRPCPRRPNARCRTLDAECSMPNADRPSVPRRRDAYLNAAYLPGLPGTDPKYYASGCCCRSNSPPIVRTTRSRLRKFQARLYSIAARLSSIERFTLSSSSSILGERSM